MGEVHCFECGKKFTLAKTYIKTYDSTALCVECYEKAMEESGEPNSEYYFSKTMRKLDLIIDVINEINNNFKKSLGKE